MGFAKPSIAVIHIRIAFTSTPMDFGASIATITLRTAAVFRLVYRKKVLDSRE